MTSDILKYLQEEFPGQWHDDLLRDTQQKVKLSRDEMRKYYSIWDKYDATYRGERLQDEKDKRAKKRQEPEKFTVPTVYAQISTFTSFAKNMLTQRKTFYELEGESEEDVKPALVAESLLEYNFRYNDFKSRLLGQVLRNITRFGVGIIKHTWHKEVGLIPQTTRLDVGSSQAVIPQTGLVEGIKYQGNKIVNVSPYNWFPDPRVPISRFQDGEFCAYDEEMSHHVLLEQERKLEIVGLKHVKKMKPDATKTRRMTFSNKITDPTYKGVSFFLYTEVQIILNPSKIILPNGKPIGEEDRPVKYLVGILNDSRIIKLEPLGYVHGDFTFNAAQYSNDDERFINFGISELLDPLQDVISWFINTRITNVRKVIQNYLVVDPKYLELSDLKNRSSVLRLKSAAAGIGIDRVIKQLNITDVTANHLIDVKTLQEFIKDTTGITENIMGQFSKGRRSAQEARNVNTNSSMRLVDTTSDVWYDLFVPLGRNLLSNLRDGMDIEQVVRIYGEMSTINNIEGVQRFLQVSKKDLIGNYDFVAFDGTLPSTKFAIAETLQELLLGLIQNPQFVLMSQYDPSLILDEILRLRGIRNANRFKLTDESTQRIQQLAEAASDTGGPESSSGTGSV